MPVDYIEMLWGCTACSASNRGRDMSCSKCGRPRDDKSPEWMPDDTSPMAAVVNPEHVRMASAGENWKCQFCGVSVRAYELTCTECGAKKDKIRAEIRADLVKRHGELVEERFGTKTGNEKMRKASTELKEVRQRLDELDEWETQHNAPSWILEALESADDEEDHDDESSAPREPELNAGYRSAGFKPEPEPEPKPEVEDTSVRRLKGAWRRAHLRTVAWIGGGLAVAGLLVLFFWWLFHTRIVNAEVVGKSWSRSIVVERYEVHGHDGWSPDADAFDVRDEGQRVHHYDHVLVGSHQESYSVPEVCGQDCSTTPRRCQSNKNGFASCSGGDRVCTNRYCNKTKYKTVNDYRDEPRHRTWFSWKLWEWSPNRTVRAAGTVDVPYWPTMEQLGLCQRCGAGEKERMSTRQESYSLRLHTVEGDTLTPDVPEGTFLTVKAGDHRKLRVGIVHGTEVLP